MKAQGVAAPSKAAPPESPESPRKRPRTHEPLAQAWTAAEAAIRETPTPSRRNKPKADSRTVSAVDTLVAVLAGCYSGTLRRIEHMAATTPQLRLLQECLLGGVQERREELWEGLSDKEQHDLLKCSFLPFCDRDKFFLQFGEST
jgi:hypothetical protein